MVFIPPELLKEKDPDERRKNLRRALLGALTGLLGFLAVLMIFALLSG